MQTPRRPSVSSIFLCLAVQHRLASLSLTIPSLFHSAGYGGIKPRITAEYDKATGFMHNLAIDYNRRMAPKKTALTTIEVKNLISDELVEAGFFVDRAFNFREDPRTEQAMIDVRKKAKKRGRGAAKAAATKALADKKK
jgi:hypothetical protein